MSEVKKNLFYQFLIFMVILIYVSKTCAQVVPLTNTRKMAQNHMQFSGFFKFFVEERYLNDMHDCDQCKLTSDTHNFYDALDIKQDKCIGKFDSCQVSTKPRNRTVSIPISQGTRTLNTSTFHLVHTCGTCICYCYPNQVQRDQKKLIDSICLDPVMVDVSQHYIIMGLQFVRVRNMIALRVFRGKIKNNYSIVIGSGSWLNPPQDCKRIAKIDHNASYFILDKSMLPDNYVVTGVSIKACDEKWKHGKKTVRTLRNCEGNFFYLTVYGTTESNAVEGIAENIIEGELSGPRSIKVRANLINDDMLPSDLAIRNKLQAPGDYYVQFRTTSWNHDKGRHIIPYINTNEVRMKPYAPIRGVGAVYSSGSEYGGYVSLQIHYIIS